MLKTTTTTTTTTTLVWCGVILQQLALHPLLLPSIKVYTSFSLIRTFRGGSETESEIFSFVCHNMPAALSFMEGISAEHSNHSRYLQHNAHPNQDATAPSGPETSHYLGFTITPRHTTVGRTSLDE